MWYSGLEVCARTGNPILIILYIQECVSNREEIKKLRRDNATLEASNHEQDKAIHQLKTRVAVLEQELHDKEQVCVN